MQTSRPPSHAEIASAIQQLATDLAEACPDASKLAIIGIARGGVELAKRLTRSLEDRLKQEIPFGVIDISFHRDDISSNPVPHVQSFANLPFDAEGKTVILVDDVLFSGRTIRAALNEIFDQGRPEKVCLAVLVDRGGRSLPIQPDFTGLKLKVNDDQRVEVSISENPDIADSITIAN